VPSAYTIFAQRRVLSERSSGPKRRLPPLPSLQAGDGPVLSGMEGHQDNRRARPKADRGGRSGPATVDALAERLGIGPRHLSRLFTEHLHASPLQVAQSLRIQRAKRLLDETDLSVSLIAERAGFVSARRMSDAFAHLYGRPPSALRKSPGRKQPGCSTQRESNDREDGIRRSYDIDSDREAQFQPRTNGG
jgi:AraC-like DNA-binding protein